MAHQCPGQWRSLVKLYMSKRAEDATALDPDDVRRELIDDEDTEYRRLTRRTSMAGLIGQEGTQAVPPVLFVTASTGQRLRVRLHLKASKRCHAMLACGGAPELSDEEVRRLDAQDLAQRRDNVAAERHHHHAARPALPGFLATCSGMFYDDLLLPCSGGVFFDSVSQGQPCA